MASAYNRFAMYNPGTPQANPDTWVANVNDAASTAVLVLVQCSYVTAFYLSLLVAGMFSFLSVLVAD